MVRNSTQYSIHEASEGFYEVGVCLESSQDYKHDMEYAQVRNETTTKQNISVNFRRVLRTRRFCELEITLKRLSQIQFLMAVP